MEYVLIMALLDRRLISSDLYSIIQIPTANTRSKTAKNDQRHYLKVGVVYSGIFNQTITESTEKTTGQNWSKFNIMVEEQTAIRRKGPKHVPRE